MSTVLSPGISSGSLETLVFHQTSSRFLTFLFPNFWFWCCGKKKERKKNEAAGSRRSLCILACARGGPLPRAVGKLTIRILLFVEGLQQFHGFLSPISRNALMEWEKENEPGPRKCVQNPTNTWIHAKLCKQTAEHVNCFRDITVDKVHFQRSRFSASGKHHSQSTITEVIHSVILAGSINSLPPMYNVALTSGGCCEDQLK